MEVMVAMCHAPSSKSTCPGMFLGLLSMNLPSESRYVWDIVPWYSSVESFTTALSTPCAGIETSGRNRWICDGDHGKNPSLAISPLACEKMYSKRGDPIWSLDPARPLGPSSSSSSS